MCGTTKQRLGNFAVGDGTKKSTYIVSVYPTNANEIAIAANGYILFWDIAVAASKARMKVAPVTMKFRPWIR
jgi:hypothetical protein